MLVDSKKAKMLWKNWSAQFGGTAREMKATNQLSKSW